MRGNAVGRPIHWSGMGVGGCVLVALLLFAGGASAELDSCREWRAEHRKWKTEVVRRYLRGAPNRGVDAAIFEMLQREAYLTSCDVSVAAARGELVGWRLVGRMPEEYGSAVLESVLERAGFDVGLRGIFEAEPQPMSASRSARSPAKPRGSRYGAR